MTTIVMTPGARTASVTIVEPAGQELMLGVTTNQRPSAPPTARGVWNVWTTMRAPSPAGGFVPLAMANAFGVTRIEMFFLAIPMVALESINPSVSSIGNRSLGRAGCAPKRDFGMIVRPFRDVN